MKIIILNIPRNIKALKKLLVIVLFLTNLSAYAGDAEQIILKPITLRKGIEGHMQYTGALDKVENYSKNRVYVLYQEMAERAGLDINKYLDEYSIVGQKKKELLGFFLNTQYMMIFINTVQAMGCERDYLIQRVKQIKTQEDGDGNEPKSETKYLVEVMKLTDDKFFKGGDAHTQERNLKRGQVKTTEVEIEVGCGEISGIAEGAKWPFETRYLYKLLQNYSLDARIYNQVKYDFSKVYKFSSKVSVDNYKVELPYFYKDYIVSSDKISVNKIAE